MIGADLRGAKLGCMTRDPKGAGPLGLFATQDCTELQNAWLDDANLQGLDLNGAHLQGASLKRAKLQGASLDRAYLQYAVLDRAQLQGASLRQANLQFARGSGRAGLRCRIRMDDLGRLHDLNRRIPQGRHQSLLRHGGSEQRRANTCTQIQ